MSTYRTVHNPSALVDAEVKLVDDQLTNMRERGVSHRTDVWKYLTARRDGLHFAQAAYRDGCVPQPVCPHFPEEES